MEGWVEGGFGVEVVGVGTRLVGIHSEAELLLVLSLQPGRGGEAIVVVTGKLLGRRVAAHLPHCRDSLGKVTKVDQVVVARLLLHNLLGRILGQEPLRVVVRMGGDGLEIGL